MVITLSTQFHAISGTHGRFLHPESNLIKNLNCVVSKSATTGNLSVPSMMNTISPQGRNDKTDSFFKVLPTRQDSRRNAGYVREHVECVRSLPGVFRTVSARFLLSPGQHARTTPLSDRRFSGPCTPRKPARFSFPVSAPATGRGHRFQP